MTQPHDSVWTRRRFLHSSMTLASAALTVPIFLERSAFAAAPQDARLSSDPGIPDDRILVVVQLGGGNDGLNTLVPFEDDAYYRVRPTIAIPKDNVLRLGRRDELGLHPALDSLKGLYDEGLLSIVQGVGYPNPNRSHFKSMDIWHTANLDGIGDGWLGKYVDAQCHGSPEEDRLAENGEHTVEPGISIGREAPLALQGRTMKPVSFETADLFRWTGQDVHDALVDPYEKLNGEDAVAAALSQTPNASFLTRTALDARVMSEQIRKAVDASPLVRYPDTRLGQQLMMVGSMIRAGLGTRVYYVSHGSFDTHAGQGGAQGSHANLLRQYAQAVASFQADLKAQGNDSRVLTMTFSEFGRRVGENGSRGTDHGTAAPMFMQGPMVQHGLVGTQPSLTDLDNGDLKFKTDFRGVYTEVLENWMGAKARDVLGKSYRGPRAVSRQ